MQSSHLHIRLPTKLKKEVQQIFEANGLDFTSAVKMFLSHVAMHQTIPLQFIRVKRMPAKLERELQETMRNPKNFLGPFRSKKALLKALYAND